MKQSKTISFVIPCYGSEHTITSVVDEIEQTMGTRPEYTYEIILVEDASPDQVYRVIRKLASRDSRIHGISFAKNFGQHSALMAGLRRSKGNIVVCMDDDGQTPANELFSLVDALDEETDVVYASYKQQQKNHSRARNFGSNLNDWMLRWMFSKPKDLEANSYFAAKRYVIHEMCRYENPFPYAGGLILQSTGRCKNVPVKHRARHEGRSGYTLRKLLSLWLNGFTAFSVVPLRAASALGFLTSGFGFLYVLYLLIRKLLDPTVLLGYSSVMGAIFIIGGILMLLMGMLGEYVGRIYMSINKNPQYVIRDQTDGMAEENEDQTESGNNEDS
jgi:undecaprenyl-phosphate 4-deoxy-4-formamido-L-arabinose transferase